MYSTGTLYSFPSPYFLPLLFPPFQQGFWHLSISISSYRYNERLDIVEPSEAEINENDLHWWMLAALRLLHRLKLVRLRQGSGPESGKLYINNLTLINLTLLWVGPCHEGTLTHTLLILQVVSSGLAFVIRYPLANLFFWQFHSFSTHSHHQLQCFILVIL